MAKNEVYYIIIIYRKNGIYFGSVLDAIHDSDLGRVLVGLGKVTAGPQRLARITSCSAGRRKVA